MLYSLITETFFYERTLKKFEVTKTKKQKIK